MPLSAVELTTVTVFLHFTGISNHLMQRLQAMQNAAACLITGARRYQHRTPIPRELHWLPMRQRILFKTAVLVYKCRHGFTLPVDILHANFMTRWSMSSTLCRVWTVICVTFKDKLQWPQFCCQKRSCCVEQLVPYQLNCVWTCHCLCFGNGMFWWHKHATADMTHLRHINDFNNNIIIINCW